MYNKSGLRIPGLVWFSRFVASIVFLPEFAMVHGETEQEQWSRGKEIYVRQCASCHGQEGEGVADHYAAPLVGDASLVELTKIIHDTMPEEDPEACTGDDALAVATYVYRSFYSELAQLKKRPPQVGIARLTANQLRQSYADLYARFDGVAQVTEKRGVTGSYFEGTRWKKEKLRIERIDPVIDFNFGRESPGEGINADGFYIHWAGSIRADVSGTYQFIVRSSCSFVFDLGKIDREFINNHVQSGDKTEFRQSIYLTAGRLYPFKIDFTQRDRKTEKPPAWISLSWIKPNGIEEIIPTEHLHPEQGPPTFSLQSVLPVDDRSYGYERGIAVNRQWDDSTTNAALEFARIANAELWPKYSRRHKDDQQENRAMLRGFLNELISTAFRTPLDEPLKKIYIDRHVDAEEDDSEAIKRALLVSLKSPRFLYPRVSESQQTKSQRAASQLSLVLHDSLSTDESLLGRAKRNELEKEWQVREMSKRMVNDYRTRGKTRDLMYEWLNLKRVTEVSKSKELYPDFDDRLVNDLRDSLDAYLDHVIWSEESDFRKLLINDWMYTTDRMAQFYGEHWQPREQPVGDGPSSTGAHYFRLKPTRSGGTYSVLTHPYLMSVLAYHDTTSPIHRGVFLIRYVLGRALRPPADAIAPLSPDLLPDLTTRERVAMQTSPEDCQGCHIKINGLGFALENYDAVGRFRTHEGKKPINASGNYTSRSGETLAFRNAEELAAYLVSSEDTHYAFVTRLFQHFVKQPPAAFGPETLDRLVKRFRETNYSIRDLITEVAVIAALHDSHPIAEDS